MGRIQVSGISFSLLVIIAAGTCYGAWQKRSLKNEAEPRECNCSAIIGVVGVNYTIETSPATDGSGGLESTGGIDAYWNGTQPTVCDHLQVVEPESYVVHVWTEQEKVSGFAGARLAGSKLVEGLATQLNSGDSSWWWDCFAVLKADHPVVEVTSDGTTWGSEVQMVPTSFPVYECRTVARDAQNNNVGQSGHQYSRIDQVPSDFDTSHPDTNYTLPVLDVLGWRATVHLESKGGAVTGDNVKVELEKAQLQFSFWSWWQGS